MKNTFIALLLSITLVITGLFVVSVAFAQNSTYNSAPANGGSTTNGQTGASTSSDNGFDWRWLLPLLAIPVLFLFLGEDKENEDTRYYDQGMAGAKGGRSRRKKENKKDSD